MEVRSEPMVNSSKRSSATSDNAGDVKWQWMIGGRDDILELVWRGLVDVACVGELRRPSASNRLGRRHV